MAESTGEEESQATPPAADFWSRLKHHRVAQWLLAYAAAAYTLLHVAEMVGSALGWPHMVARVITLALILGAPVAALLAWYHGDKTRHRISGAELAILTVLLAIAGGLLWAFSRGGHEGASPTATAAAQHASIPADEKSVAVLPFTDLSPGKDQEYFADGISEEILNSLAGIKDLKVSGRTSSFSFKGKNEDMKVIGEKLGVAHLLEGSVRKSGDQLRITAQLVKTSDGFHLWSQTYDRPLADIFKVQEEIAASVARALEVTLGVGALAGSQGMTRNVEAYDAYLAGRALQDTMTPESIRKSGESFQRATRVDPDFAVAWYALANSYAMGTQFERVSDEERRRLNGQASVAIDQVSRVLPKGPHRSAYAAGNAVDAGDWGAAERELRKVKDAREGMGLTRELDAINPVQAVYLLATDRPLQAISLLERQRATDPLSSTTSLFLGEAYANSGNLAAAIAEQDRGMQLENVQSVTRPSALITALATGDRQLIDKRLALTVGDTSFGIDLNAELKPYLDRPDEALRVLRRLAASNPNPILIGGMALWAAYFGDTKLSLELLRDPTQSVSRANQALTFWRPIMHNVRQQPGFKDLLRETGLVDYWREFGWGEHCRPVGKDDFECT
jgi:TolB-like protein/tetratricopeptide (TPR) repeat protein